MQRVRNVRDGRLLKSDLSIQALSNLKDSETSGFRC